MRLFLSVADHGGLAPLRSRRRRHRPGRRNLLQPTVDRRVVIRLAPRGYGRRLACGKARFQIGDHLAHRLVSIVRLLGHHPAKHGIEIFGDFGPHIPHPGNRLLPVCQKGLHHRVALVHRLAGHEPIERAAQAVDVAALICLPRVFGLLGRHVVDRPHDLARARQSLGSRIVADHLGEPCQAHVEDFDRALLVDQ